MSGDARDIHATDQAVLDMFPDNDHLHRWIRAAQDRVAFQGLPARIHAGGPRCGRERRSRARACWPMRWFAEHALLPGGPARDVATAMEAALGPLREPA
ncbi:MAG TPA: hypothetical protein VMV92_27630 [Streptosporangiaceae bacterium]|nr:hypothetical protein [Streptosporangiaceae bacterium]